MYAPGSGEITIFFETGHAIGMKLDNGAEVLIHVGIDTVNLQGKYFTPKVKAPDSTQLSQISNIVFADPTKKLKGKKKEEKIENAIKVFKCAEDLLKKIVEEIPDFQQMLDNKILSAQLLVKFTKPRKMEEEDYEKLLGAYMKPISDADGVTFKLKNGKKITGSNILRTKNVEIETIDDVRISEPALIQEMEEFLRELNSEL